MCKQIIFNFFKIFKKIKTKKKKKKKNTQIYMKPFLNSPKSSILESWFPGMGGAIIEKTVFTFVCIGKISSYEPPSEKS
jgi:hypothetical protein